MERRSSFLGIVFLLFSLGLKAQYALNLGPASGTTALITYSLPNCIANGSSTVTVCGFNVTFAFTNTQISSCPTSGQITAPGSVAYGGPGSSSSFLFYHTLSYSPSNENQRLTFAQKIHTFQFSASGPAGSAEPFGIQVYDGGSLVGSFSFTAPGVGQNRTYTITGPQFDRIDFVETNAISADDELFGDFFVASAGCPFSLEFLNSSLEVLPGNDLNIVWQTQNENNMSHFEVQRSTDGLNWNMVALKDANNLPDVSTYSYTDKSLPQGHYFYQINMVQADGTTNAGKIMEVEIGNPSINGFDLFPNPAQNQLQIDFKSIREDREFVVLNITGAEIQRWKSSETALDLDISKLENGLYFLRVSTNEATSTQRFTVSR